MFFGADKVKLKHLSGCLSDKRKLFPKIVIDNFQKKEFTIALMTIN